jgi:hypothetical protein
MHIKTKTQVFSLREVLSVITKHNLSEDNVVFCKILEHMFQLPGLSVASNTSFRAMLEGRGGYLHRIDAEADLAIMVQVCQPYLKKQFPQFTSAQFKKSLTALSSQVEKAENQPEKLKVVNKWLAAQVREFGDSFNVDPIPNGRRVKARNRIYEYYIEEN